MAHSLKKLVCQVSSLIKAVLQISIIKQILTVCSDTEKLNNINW